MLLGSPTVLLSQQRRDNKGCRLAEKRRHGPGRTLLENIWPHVIMKNNPLINSEKTMHAAVSQQHPIPIALRSSSSFISSTGAPTDYWDASSCTPFLTQHKMSQKSYKLTGNAAVATAILYIQSLANNTEHLSEEGVTLQQNILDSAAGEAEPCVAVIFACCAPSHLQQEWAQRLHPHKHHHVHITW